MKKHKIIFLILIAALCNTYMSCKKKEPVYYQFTDEELKWIYYDNMNPKYAVYDFDTIHLAGHDSIFITRKADITGIVQSGYSKNEWAYAEAKHPYSFDEGQAELNTCREGRFQCLARCNIEKISDNLCITVYLNGLRKGNIQTAEGVEFKIELNSINYTSVTISSNTYQAWVYNSFQSTSMYKVLYFAPNYGFVKIELADGRKMELLN